MNTCLCWRLPKHTDLKTNRRNCAAFYSLEAHSNKAALMRLRRWPQYRRWCIRSRALTLFQFQIHVLAEVSTFRLYAKYMLNGNACPLRNVSHTGVTNPAVNIPDTRGVQQCQCNQVTMVVMNQICVVTLIVRLQSSSHILSQWQVSNQSIFFMPSQN